MAESGESKGIFSKEWFQEASLLALPFAFAYMFVQLFSGKFRKWGEHVHGHRYDGSHIHEYPYNHESYEPKKEIPAQQKAA